MKGGIKQPHSSDRKQHNYTCKQIDQQVDDFIYMFQTGMLNVINFCKTI